MCAMPTRHANVSGPINWTGLDAHSEHSQTAEHSLRDNREYSTKVAFLPGLAPDKAWVS